MKEITLIIHGYSDCSDSFKDIKNFLINNNIGDVKTVYFADYQSREDSLTFDDIVDGLNDQFIKNGFIDSSGNKKVHLNVIVHSTGGLVIRHWIWRYYYKYGRKIEKCPVKKILMLAPANFGSPLAHRGKSFLGHLVKGRWKVGDLLEVGENILNGLELASPYQWWLAHNDLLIEDSYYNENEIQVIVITGLKEYSGLRKWVNKPGTDGTVVISGTFLNTIKFFLDFSKSDNNFKWLMKSTPFNIGFTVISNENHGSIVENFNKNLAGEICLKFFDKNCDFLKLKKELKDLYDNNYNIAGADKYQQFIFHAVDDQENPVKDFLIEFLIEPEELTDEFSELIENVHKNSIDSSFRCFTFNISKFDRKFFQKDIKIFMKIYLPPVEKGIKYNLNLNKIKIYDSKENSKINFFYPDTTTLVELKVNRINQYVKVSFDSSHH